MESPTTRYRSYNHLLAIIINLCLSTFIYGYSMSYFNSIPFPDLMNIFSIQTQSPSTLQGIYTSSLHFTAGLGAYSSSLLLSLVSRKSSLQLLSVLTILSSLLVLIRSPYWLMLARCIQGVIAGTISSITPIYIREMSPVELASSLCPWNQIGIVLGLTCGFVVDFIMGVVIGARVDSYWWVVFAFPVLPALAQLYNFWGTFPYETPKWLMMNNRTEDAKQLLSVIYKDQYVEQAYNQINKALLNPHPLADECEHHPEDEDHGDFTKTQLQQTISPINHEMKQIKQKQEKQKKQGKQQKEMEESLLQKKTEIVTCPLAIIAAYSLSASQQLVGMGAIIAYSGEIVGQIFPSIHKVFPICINLIALSGAFLSIKVLKILGRKKSLELGALAISLLLLFLAYLFHKTSFNSSPSSFSSVSATQVLICVTLLSIRLIFSFTTGPIVWLYIAQTVQPRIAAYATMINWLTLAVVNLTFPIFKHWLQGNPALIFGFFGICTLGSYFCNRFVLIQTENKSEYHINREYWGKWRNILKN